MEPVESFELSTTPWIVIFELCSGATFTSPSIEDRVSSQFPSLISGRVRALNMLWDVMGPFWRERQRSRCTTSGLFLSRCQFARLVLLLFLLLRSSNLCSDLLAVSLTSPRSAESKFGGVGPLYLPRSEGTTWTWPKKAVCRGCGCLDLPFLLSHAEHTNFTISRRFFIRNVISYWQICPRKACWRRQAEIGRPARHRCLAGGPTHLFTGALASASVNRKRQVYVFSWFFSF